MLLQRVDVCMYDPMCVSPVLLFMLSDRKRTLAGQQLASLLSLVTNSHLLYCVTAAASVDTDRLFWAKKI